MYFADVVDREFSPVGVTISRVNRNASTNLAIIVDDSSEVTNSLIH